MNSPHMAGEIRIICVMIEQVELVEQDLIQLIRTSGLKKPRETLLVDKLLDLRKLRRQTFAELVRDNKELRDSSQSTTSEVNFLKFQLESVNTNKANEISSLVTNHQSELKTLELKHQHSLQSLTDKIKEKYQHKFYELSRKISDLEGLLHEKNERKLAEEAQFQRSHQEQISKYQESLQKLSQREHELTLRLASQHEQIKSQEAKLSDVGRTIMQLKFEIRQRDTQVEDLTQLTKQQQTELVSYEQQLASLKAEHESELSEIDEKIRAILKEKDNKMVLYQESLVRQQQKYKLLESTLEELNQNLR